MTHAIARRYSFEISFNRWLGSIALLCSEVNKMMWPEERMQRKTYGRIFVAIKEHIKIVEDTIKEIDEFEVGYMPKEIVAVYGKDSELIYLHKFEIDVNALAKACMDKCVWIWVVDNVRDSSA